LIRKGKVLFFWDIKSTLFLARFDKYARCVCACAGKMRDAGKNGTRFSPANHWGVGAAVDVMATK